MLTAVKNGRKGRWCIKSRRRCTDYFFLFGLILLVLLILIIVGGVPSSFFKLRHVSVTISSNVQDID
ncbi:hypothetical protein PP707_07330 [Acetobacter pasteurianus]|nr:hypothetical protein [Acetobacter pasteurianus]